MNLRYKELVLMMPSLCQGNRNHHKSGKWCGRASASMIYNYYVANRSDGIEGNEAKFITNRRHAPPYNLVYPEGGLAAPGYVLIEPMRKAKKKFVRTHLYRAPREGTVDEAKCREILEPVLRSLEMFNPVLAYTGLSPRGKGGVPQHIVVISGYRVVQGVLWLHFDDPGTSTPAGKDAAELGYYFSTNHFRNYKAGGRAQLRDDNVENLLPFRFGDEIPGRRFWGRAKRLFEENYWSDRKNDLLCDAKCSKGLKFTVEIDLTGAEDRGPCVMTVDKAPPLPVNVRFEPELEGSHSFAKLRSAWGNVRSAGAPFPLGANRSWHNGIHFEGESLENDEVHAIGPGEIAMVRFPERGDDGVDGGAVLLRHGLDPDTLAFVSPLAVDAEVAAKEQAVEDATAAVEAAETPKAKKARTADLKKRKKAAAAAQQKANRIVWLYTMCTHLCGGHDGSAPLHHLLVGDAPAEELPAPGYGELLGYRADGGSEVVVLGGEDAVGRAVKPHEATTVKTDQGARERLPIADGDSNLEAWERQPRRAPQGAPQGLYNPATGAPIVVGEVDGVAPLLSVQRSGRDLELVTVARADDGAWRQVESQDQPGLDLTDCRHCVHDSTVRAKLKLAPQKYTALLLRGPKAKFTVGDQEQWHTMTLPSATAPELFCCAPGTDQHALAPDAKDKATVWPVLEPCIAEPTSDGAPVTIAPRGAKLSLFNPATNRVYATTVRVRAGTSLTGVRKAGYVGIDGYKPRLRVRHKRGCVHDAASRRQMLALEDKHWPLLSVTAPVSLYPQTKGSGRRRSFKGTALKATDALYAVGDGPKKTAGKLRVWPKLEPCVQLDAKAERRVRAGLRGAGGQTLRRLVGNQSRLAAVSLDEDTGWILRGNAVCVRPEFKGDVVVYGGIDVGAKGTARTVELGGGESRAVALKVRPGIKLRRVDTFVDRRNGTRYALVELSHGARVEDFEREQRAWVENERWAAGIRADAIGGKAVDLIAEDRRKEVQAGDLLGRVGRMERGRDGLHFEVFAGQDLRLTDTPTYRTRTIEGPKETGPLPPDKWWEIFEDLAEDQQFEDAAIRHPEIDDARGTRGPIRPQLWRDFCADRKVEIALSRVVAIHPTEWKADWWPAEMELPRLAGDRWHFHHPLRFLEWMQTGIDAHVDHDGKETPGVTMTWKGDEFVLAPAAEHDEWFRLRMTLGEVSNEGPATLTLNDVDTANPEIPVVLRRGELQTIRLCQPRVTMRGRKPKESVHVIHVLRGCGRPLPKGSHRKAVFDVAANYNLDQPGIEVELSAKRETRLEVRREGKLVASQTPSTVSIAPEIVDKTKPLSGCRRANVAIEVSLAEPYEAGAEVTVEASGGDLTKSTTLRGRVAVRDIKAEKHGEDVRLLQEHLSRIMVGRKPCYGKAWSGRYGKQTATAIWRFIFAFFRTKEWDWDALSKIESSKKLVELGSIKERKNLNPARAFKFWGYPLITKPLVAEILKRFRVPEVWPELSLSVVAPTVDPRIADKVVALNIRGQTTVLPDEDSATVTLDVDLVGLEPEGTADLWTTIVIPPGCPFDLEGAAKWRVEELLERQIRLTPNGRLSTKECDCTIRIEAEGKTLASVRLGGTRNLLKTRGKATRGLDAIQVQSWLIDLGNKADGKPFFAEKYLGYRFSTKSREGLREFRKLQKPKPDYAALIAKLEEATSVRRAAAE